MCVTKLCVEAAEGEEEADEEERNTESKTEIPYKVVGKPVNAMLSSFDHCHDVASEVFGSQQDWRLSELTL